MTISTSSLDRPAKYLNAEDCGRRYQVSKRTWLRLVDAGKAPSPVRLNRLVRWPISELESWEATGCKPVRYVGKGVGR